MAPWRLCSAGGSNQTVEHTEGSRGALPLANNLQTPSGPRAHPGRQHVTGSESGTRDGFDVTRSDGLSAGRAHQHCVGDRAAPGVEDLQRRSGRSGVFVPPLPHRGEDGPEVASFVRESIVVARWVLGVRHARQDALVDQSSESLLQDVPRDPEPTLEVVEAADTQEDVPDDEHAPPLADDLEALGDRAVHVGEALPFHELSLEGCIIECNRLGSVP